MSQIEGLSIGLNDTVWGLMSCSDFLSFLPSPSPPTFLRRVREYFTRVLLYTSWTLNRLRRLPLLEKILGSVLNMFQRLCSTPTFVFTVHCHLSNMGGLTEIFFCLYRHSSPLQFLILFFIFREVTWLSQRSRQFTFCYRRKDGIT